MPNLLFWLISFGIILLFPTAYAAKIGAPYAPTFSAAIKQAFGYIKLSSSDLIVDIGAGDGRVLLEAERHGAKALGYELSPIMWFIIKLRTLRRNKKIKIKLANFYKAELPPETTTVFAFLMPENMARVRRFLAKQHLPQAKYMLVYAFPFKDANPVHIIHAPKCAKLYIYDLSRLVSVNGPPEPKS